MFSISKNFDRLARTAAGSSPTLKLRFIPSGSLLTPPSLVLMPNMTSAYPAKSFDRTTVSCDRVGSFMLETQDKIYFHCGADAGLAVDCDRSAEIFNSLLHDRQAETHPVSLRGEIRLKQPDANFPGYTGPGIGKRDPDDIAVRACRDANAAALFHRLYSISNNIDEGP